jgi:phage host-nuclease inhibitor protein Gam
MGFLEQHPELAYGIMTFLIGIVGWFINRKVNEMEKDISTLKNDVSKIKGNYLDRFDDLKDRMNDQHDELIKEITKLTIMIEKQSSYCQVMQDMKKNSK